MFGLRNIIGADWGIASDLGLHHAAKAEDTPATKSELIRVARLMLIGSVILFSSSTIIKIVFKLFI